MKHNFYYWLTTILLAFFLLGMLVLSGCPAPDAQAKIKFKIMQDTLFGSPTPSPWEHPIDSLFPVVFKWGPQDSMLTNYRGLYKGFSLNLTEGSYQFEIYPLNPPRESSALLWKYKTVQHIQQSSYVVMVYPSTDYYLLLLDNDSGNTWGWRDPWDVQGYKYKYYHADSLPSLSLTIYQGGNGQDTTSHVVKIDNAVRGKVYPVRVFLSFDVELFINHKFSMSMADTTFFFYK